MKMRKGYKFRLILSEDQELLASKTAGVCRFIYNLGLQQRSDGWLHGRHRISYPKQCKEIPELKKECPWIAEVPYHCVQQALKNLQTAYENFWKWGADYPTFKRKFHNDSFRFPDPKQFVVDEGNQRIKLPKFGWISYRNGNGRHALKLSGNIKSITVSRSADKWFASILCESETPDPEPVVGPQVGVDLGVVRSLTLSTQDEPIQVRGMTKEDYRKQKHLQRHLDRKQKGSSNRKKAGLKLARFRASIARRRRDSIHKATTFLAKNHSLIVLEDLKIPNMVKSARGTKQKPGKRVKQKSGLNRSILNQGWGEIKRQMTYKCQWYGSTLILINPKFTSQECRKCHHISKNNRISQSVFLCEKCGHLENADINSSHNILAAGQAVIACGGNSVCSLRTRNLQK